MSAILAAKVLLGVFLASWLASGLWAGRKAAASPMRPLATIYIAGAAFGLALVALAILWPAATERLWPEQPLRDWLLVVLVVAGAAWCWWARLHIGKLWAAGVVVREGHRVVDTGPYAAVRHPIYSGAFVAIGAYLLAQARPIDLLFGVGFVLFFAAKAKVEEGFLVAQLGEEYEAYRQRVPMLVPRWRGLRAAFGSNAIMAADRPVR